MEAAVVLVAELRRGAVAGGRRSRVEAAAGGRGRAALGVTGGENARDLAAAEMGPAGPIRAARAGGGAGRERRRRWMTAWEWLGAAAG